MAEKGVGTIRTTCPNCKYNFMISEHQPKCPKCGRVFVEYMNKMSKEDIIERSKNRRTGKDVDKLDG